MKAGSVIVASLLTVGVLAGVMVFIQPQAAVDSKTGELGEEEEIEFEPPEISPTGPYPKAVCDNTDHYFGVLELGEKGSHTFEIRNEGEAPLVIKQGETSCKCTVGNVSEGAVAPGEVATVTLEWEPELESEVFEQQANIWTNDPENRTFELRISGEIHARISVVPEDGLELGLVEHGQFKEGVARIYSDVLDHFELTEIEVLSDAVEVTPELIPKEVLDEHGARFGYLLNIKLSSDIPIGRYVGTIRIKTDQSDSKVHYIEVIARRNGPYTIVTRPGATWYETDQIMSLGRFNAADGVNRSALMFIVEAGDEPIVFEDLDVQPDYLQVKFEDVAQKTNDGRQRFDLTISVPPGMPTTVLDRANPGIIRAKTNHPKMKDFKIMVHFVSL